MSYNPKVTISAASGVTGYLRMALYEATAPEVEVAASEQYAPPHSESRQIQFTGLSEVIHLAKLYVTDGVSPTGTQIANFSLDPRFPGESEGSFELAAIGAAPNANGATFADGVFNLEPADGSFGGVIVTGAQTIPGAGAKTFAGDVNIDGATRLAIALTGILKAASGAVGIAVSGTDIKTINSTSILGSGNISIPIGWSLTGNAGTNPATDFVGTTDNQDVKIKRNNVEFLKLTTNDFTITAPNSVIINFGSGEQTKLSELSVIFKEVVGLPITLFAGASHPDDFVVFYEPGSLYLRDVEFGQYEGQLWLNVDGSFQQIFPGKNWKTLGNDNIDSSIEYIGTQNEVDVFVKRNARHRIGVYNDKVVVVNNQEAEDFVFTSANASENNEWRSVTYGNGLFVAVSSTGTNRVMTSPDGATWTARSAAQNNFWTSVTWGNGLFVAVSNAGTNRVMTSPDGITWTARTAAEANTWYSVTWGNGLFVAVSNGGTNRVMTSPDGITWTARAAAEANVWTSVTYGNGLFVAVSSNGTNRAMTSPDGITWTARAAVSSDWSSVTFGNGMFVAVAIAGSTNRVMSSPDGITWTGGGQASNTWWSVTHGNGLFVAVNTGPGTSNRVMYSTDGLTWTNIAAHNFSSWLSVTYGNGLFVAVSNGFNPSTVVMYMSYGTMFLGVGIPNPTATLHIKGSTVDSALMQLEIGPAPHNPNDGDIWLESNTNTGLKIRIAGVTKTITLS